jgi:diguanylate cyclase (GGDEF)-like protein
VLPEIPETAIQSNILKLPPVTPLTETITAMATTQMSCVIAVEGQRLAGILTQRDIVRLLSSDLVLSTLTLADVMTRGVITLTVAEAQDFSAMSQRFSQHRVRHLPVVNDQNQVVGVVTPTTVRNLFKPEHLLRSLRARDVMTSTVIQGLPDDSILTLAKRMATCRISCVVIVAQAKQPVGIITERDIVQFQSLGLALEQMVAQRVMSTPLSTLHPQDSLWQVHQTMQQLHVRRLVITHPTGELAGLVTQTQLLQVLDPLELHQVMQQIQATMDQQTLELQQLNQELQTANTKLAHLAAIDELTQVLNRRRLNERLETEWQRLARLQAPLSLIICDLDSFKAYNDTYGHPAGDDCLVRIAQVLQQITRPALDFVARYGGEEFVVVLPHIDSRGAEQVAKDILMAVQQLQIPHAAANPVGDVTVSLGVATIVPNPTDSPRTLLEAADQLLYQSKQRGRNTYSFQVLAPSS